ncbi:MAG: hypothetical protein QOE42_2206 [Chloroflexota bacterium]|nr:hypothetical protein [Chloroflexota bacterium]
MPVATGVDVARPRPAATVSGTSPLPCPPEGLIAMSPLAAYYVMIATDHENGRRPRPESIVPRPSLAVRIVNTLETMVRLGRPATTQPI